MLCPNCESQNRPGAKFCDQCGFPLTGAIARFAQSSLDAQLNDESQIEDDVALDIAEADVADEVEDKAEESAEATAEAGFESVDYLDENRGEGTEDEASCHGEDVGDNERLGEDDEAPSLEEDAPESYDAVEGDSLPEQVEPADAGVDEDGAEPAEDLAATDSTQAIDDLAASEDVTQVLDDFPIVFDEEPPADVTQRIDDLWVPDATMQMPRIEADDPSQSRDYMASATKEQQHGSRKGIIIGAIVAVVVVLAALAGTYAMGMWGGKQVPDVSGMTESDARAVLEGDGFTVKALQVKSDDTEGLVLLMDPSGDTRAPEGSEVVIHVATARLIPDVNGQALEDAKAMLADAGYDSVEVVEQKDNGDEGLVLAVEPEAGSRAKSTTPVTLTVSQAYRVPDVSGMGTWDAYAAIEAEGLTPTIVYVDTLEYIDGTLLGVYPESGTKMAAGDYVSLNVARARAYQLESLTQSYLAPGNTISYNGYSFVIESLGSVSYAGNDTVAFTATARPQVTLFGETLFTSAAQTISGSVVWSADNQVVGVY